MLVALALTGCGGTTTPTPPPPIVLLDMTVTLVQGAACNTGYIGLEFAGVAGKTVVISAVGGAALTPLFTLYAPDFATQLGGSAPAGPGSASLSVTLQQQGVHHVSVCDLNGIGGLLRITATQQ